MMAQTNPDLKPEEVRSELRKEFLQICNQMTDRKCEIQLFSGFQSGGTLRAVDREIMNFGIEDLKTPIGIEKVAVLRSSDVNSLTVKFKK